MSEQDLIESNYTYEELYAICGTGEPWDDKKNGREV